MKKIRRRVKDLKYRHKLSILIVIASLIPVMIISVYTQFGTRRLLEENERGDLSDTLEQSVDAISNQVDIYGNLINYLSFSQELRKIVDTQYDSDYEAYLEYTEVADPMFTLCLLYTSPSPRD